MKAVFNGKVIAESPRTVLLESNHYFPKDALNMDYFNTSDTRTICPWKGTAHYYSVTVDGQQNKDAAWYYPDPLKAAAYIKDHVAFWRGVEVIE